MTSACDKRLEEAYSPAMGCFMSKEAKEEAKQDKARLHAARQYDQSDLGKEEIKAAKAALQQARQYDQSDAGKEEIKAAKADLREREREIFRG